MPPSRQDSGSCVLAFLRVKWDASGLFMGHFQCSPVWGHYGGLFVVLGKSAFQALSTEAALACCFYIAEMSSSGLLRSERDTAQRSRRVDPTRDSNFTT